MPLIIHVGKICCFCTFFVIIKIKHEKSACSIWQQWIYTDYVRTIFLISQQMRNDFLHVQFCPFFIFTLIAKYLFSTLFRTKFNIPSIITLWKITAIFAAPGIDILSSPKHRKEAYRHLLRNKRRMDNTRSLIEIILFCIFYCLFKRISLIIWNIFFFQFIF